MNESAILYIISISLQIAGSTMLFFFSLSTKRNNIIKNFAKSHMIIRDGNTKELSYSHQAFIETYQTAYYSKASVGYISAGYILGVFGGASNSDKTFIVAGIVILTTIIILITKIIIYKILKTNKVNKRITDDELTMVGAVPDMESISDEEIYDM